MTEWQDYFKPGQLDPLPDGKASLYRGPWRSNPRTASAYDALNGLGVYYKHLAPDPNIVKQMSEAGVKRLRLAPHHCLYINEDWTGLSLSELQCLTDEFFCCSAATIRPCVCFVHIPPQGEGAEMSQWMKRPWNKGLMPIGSGQPGDRDYDAYFDKVYKGLKAVMDTARAQGYTAEGSYDIEMGCNLWWGAPALPPNPALTREMLQPGQQVWEFERLLLDRARKEGYSEPTFWNGQCYHHFDQQTDGENFPGVVGRAISFYSTFLGVTGKNLAGSDPWPARPPLAFAEGEPPPGLVLCKPEGYMADFSRRDNLINLLLSSRAGIAISSLGMVPSDIPSLTVVKRDYKGSKKRVKAPGVDGWEIKSRSLARSYAFWLNQGAQFVLLHSAYEEADDEMSQALIPNFGKTPGAFRWQDSRPLKTIHSFATALSGAKPIAQLDELRFSYRLAEDSELIAASVVGDPLMASDAVAILPFQVTATKFAVAIYIVTPDASRRLKIRPMTLALNKRVTGTVKFICPSTQSSGLVEVAGDATMTFGVSDDVTLLLFEVT